MIISVPERLLRVRTSTQEHELHRAGISGHKETRLHQIKRSTGIVAAVASPELRKTEQKQSEGHSALLQGLGEVGDVATVHVPWLLRLAHIRHASFSCNRFYQLREGSVTQRYD